MTIQTKPQPLSVNIQPPIQTIVPPVGWRPRQIIYQKITFSMTTSGLQIFYHPASQIVPGNDIDGFINQLFNSPLVDLTVSSTSSPLDFTIYGKKGPKSTTPLPGYLVFELDRAGNWTYQPDVDAVTIGDSNSSSSDYFNLVHVTNPTSIAQGGRVPKKTPGGTAPGPNCNIAYFSYKSPSVNGALKKTDFFNLYAAITVGSKQLDLIIDPGITNTGGPPPGSGLGGKFPRRRRHT